MHSDASRSPFIELRPKRFVLVPTYEDHTRKVEAPPYADDLAGLRRRIVQGIAVEPRFYRKDPETTSDQLLDLLGIKHLHLGGQNSDVLIYLVEYDDFVAVLEINDHKHFRSDPIGQLLRAHEDALETVRKAQAEASARIEERVGKEDRRKRSLEAARVRAREAAAAMKTDVSRQDPSSE